MFSLLINDIMELTKHKYQKAFDFTILKKLTIQFLYSRHKNKTHYHESFLINSLAQFNM